MAAIFRPIVAVSHRPKHISAVTRAPAMANAVVCLKTEKRKFPVFLFDVMDTIVRDPFYHDIPAFFKKSLIYQKAFIADKLLIKHCVLFEFFKTNMHLLSFKLMSMKELLDKKHPTAWVEFEKGLIDETELAKKFFKDGRPFDLEGLKECLRRGYSYVDGIEELLLVLKHNNYEVHAFTNYPVWYKMIEEKLKLSKYLSWTFSSCIIGKRKPASDSYAEVIHQLNIEPASCIFIDDRVTNVEAAVSSGMVGIHFKNADSLKQDLSLVGVELGVFNSK